MKFKRLLTTTVLSLLVVVAVTAQDENRGKLKSYSFIEVQGGGQMTYTNFDKKDLVTPTAAISIGHYFTPVVGLRLHANGGKAKSGYRSYDADYKWKYVTGDLDLLLNVTNLFSSKPNHLLNLVLLGGFGVNRAWDNNELKDVLATYPSIQTPLAWNKNHLSHNLRAGARLETNVTKPVGLSLEVNANSVDDRFNSKMHNDDDWQWTAMLGLSVRFGKKYVKPAPVAIPIVEEVVETASAEVAPAPVVVEEKPKLVTVTVPEKMHEEIFYVIAKSDAAASAELERVQSFMKRNPNATVTVVGYADKGTGSVSINQRISEQRANKVAQRLVDEYGISRDRISVDAKGDTVQPFAENDKNRCVIIEGEGSHTENHEQK